MTWWNRLNNLSKISGDDYSAKYVENKNAFFYIGKEDGNGTLLAFKPFLDNISYTLKVQTKKVYESVTNANSPVVITGVDLGIKISLNLPAVSIDEARANAAKIAALMSWLQDEKLASQPQPDKTWCKNVLNDLKKNGMYKNGKLVFEKQNKGKDTEMKKSQPIKWNGIVYCVSKAKGAASAVVLQGRDAAYRGKSIVFLVNFANLIHSGEYTEEHTILKTDSKGTYKEMLTYGLRSFISNFKDEIDVDMGFFEDGTTLLPKVHKLSFDLDVLNIPRTGLKRNILGFSDSTIDSNDKYSIKSDYHKDDVQTWPFGVVKNIPKPKITNNYAFKYSSAKNGFIKFQKHDQSIEFMPLIKNFSIERKIDKANMHEFKHLTGKDRLVFDTKMPKFNISFTVSAINLSHAKAIHLNLQKLMRMIYPPSIVNSTVLARLQVKFANLIGISENGAFAGEDWVTCICSSLNIKPNLDMGFFEDGGMLYMKTLDLSFDLEVNDDGWEG